MKRIRRSTVLLALMLGIILLFSATAVANEDFIPVTDIIDVPNEAAVGIPFTLKGTVLPAGASNKDIVWSIKDDGGIGATINGNTLYTSGVGLVEVTATITNGLSNNDIAAVAVGYNNIVVLKNDGSIWTWECNEAVDYWDPPIISTYRIGTDNDWTAITAGGGFGCDDHALALKEDGSLWAWGGNSWGQLGDGTKTYRPSPVRVGTDNDWAIVATSEGNYSYGAHTMAIKKDGSLWAWGENYWGQLGDGTGINQSIPVRIGTDNDWTAVSPAILHTAALKTGGSLWAWGLAGLDLSVTPVRIGLDNDWAMVAAGGMQTLALKEDGSLWNGYGNSDSVIRIGVDTDWVAIAAGLQHAIALKKDNSMWAWGDNSEGQLGDGTRINRSDPVRVGLDNNWAAVAAKNTGSVALKKDNSLWVWGSALFYDYFNYSYGLSSNIPVQLGSYTKDFTIEVNALPVTDIINVPDETLVGVPLTLTYTVVPENATSKGIIWNVKDVGSTGATITDNILNTNGAGTVVITATIANSLGGGGIAGLAAGFGHNLALNTDGNLWAWGYNESGQLGNGTNINRSTPIHIGTSNDWAAVATGDAHSIALKTDGSLWSWGFNRESQLGDGMNTNRNVPARIGTDNDWALVTAGVFHTTALKTDGSLWAWGNNADGQLGNGTNDNRLSPGRVGSDNNWATLVAGDYHNVALKKDGSLWAWGNNSNGQLGDGTNTNCNAPVRIGMDVDWAAVAAGGGFTMALKNDGSLWAWGNNYYSQLGDGTNINSNTPVRIGMDDDWSAVAVGRVHTVALKVDGSLWAWGNNNNGQLGDGTIINRNVPVRIGTENDWTVVVAGSYHNIALKKDGRRWAWGSNDYGNLGTGKYENSRIPVEIASPGYFTKDFTITVTPTLVVLDSIAATTLPTKTVYFQGETIDLTGMVVTATYSDSSSKAVTDYTTDPINDAVLNTVGVQTVTVSYTEDGVTKTTSFTILVNAIELEKIEVITNPTKAVYFAGETLDLTGMVVTATYNNGDTTTVTGYTTIPATGAILNTVGVQTVTVNYGGKSTSFTVIVNAVELDKIEVTINPTKAVYLAGEALDLTGMVVTATYNNGDTSTVTGYTTNPAAGAILNAVGVQTVMVNYGGKSTSFTVTVNAVELDKIEVTTPSTKAVYFAGEALDLTGMVVTATYNNGDTEAVTGYTTVPAAGAILNTVGVQTVTVNYGGKSTSFTVTVNAVELDKIEVTTPSTKAVYFAGEALDLTGMVVTATYNNGDTTTVTGYTTVPAAGTILNTVGVQTVTVNYGGKSTSFTVTVNAVELDKIEVTTNPTKSVYFAGEVLDLTGMVVTATYNNGDTTTVTGYTTNPAAGAILNTVGVQTVMVNYGGKSTSFTVTVNAVELDKIEVTTPPTKAVYFAGEALDLTGMVVTATYNNGDTEAVTGYTTNPAAGAILSTIGTQTIIVSYDDKIDFFFVTVNPLVPVSITLDITSTVIYLEETLQITATVLPDNALDKSLTWTSSDDSVVMVSTSGLVTAASEGSATITATTVNGLTAICSIIVLSAIPEMPVCITLDITAARLHPGETLQLIETVLPTNAPQKSVTWTTSDSSITTVSAGGLVKAITPGEVIITATTVNGLTAICVVTVPSIGMLSKELGEALKAGFILGLFDSNGSYQSISASHVNAERQLEMDKIDNAIKQYQNIIDSLRKDAIQGKVDAAFANEMIILAEKIIERLRV